MNMLKLRHTYTQALKLRKLDMSRQFRLINKHKICKCVYECDCQRLIFSDDEKIYMKIRDAEIRNSYSYAINYQLSWEYDTIETTYRQLYKIKNIPDEIIKFILSYIYEYTEYDFFHGAIFRKIDKQSNTMDNTDPNKVELIRRY